MVFSYIIFVCKSNFKEFMIHQSRRTLSLNTITCVKKVNEKETSEVEYMMDELQFPFDIYKTYHDVGFNGYRVPFDHIKGHEITKSFTDMYGYEYEKLRFTFNVYNFKDDVMSYSSRDPKISLTYFISDLEYQDNFGKKLREDLSIFLKL